MTRVHMLVLVWWEGLRAEERACDEGYCVKILVCFF